jgi:hypothetical protein
MRTRLTDAIGQTNATCTNRFPLTGAQEIFGRPFETLISTRRPPLESRNRGDRLPRRVGTRSYEGDR